MPAASSVVDLHVGLRMRERREALGISQGRLGRHLGVAFSQIQKYEKGANRIGAGRLYQIADLLGVSPNWFFEGMDVPDASPTGTRADRPRHPEEARLLLDAFERIDDPDTRASVLAFGVHEEPRPAAHDRYVAQGDGGDPRAPGGQAAVVRRALLCGRHTGQSLGLDEELPAEGEFVACEDQSGY